MFAGQGPMDRSGRVIGLSAVFVLVVLVCGGGQATEGER